MQPFPDDPKLWLRRFGPTRPGAIQLICFPHAGGTATFFAPLATHMPGALQVVGVQYPGRQDRRNEPPVGTIAGLADRIAQVLPADRPIAFFGHSMGAALAFEVALRMEAAGAALSKVFVSARCAPSHNHRIILDPDDDRSIVNKLKQLGGTESAFLDDDELLQMILPAIRSDYRAIQAYHCPAGVRIASGISAMLGDFDPHVSVEDMRAWADHTAGEFSFKTFSGGHFYLAEHLEEVAKTLRSELAG
jgi:pyochelin biosynthetic protein PchC